ncbi:hypothetical protein TeGR_g11233, partial [Tetraparma gracilis]
LRAWRAALEAGPGRVASLPAEASGEVLRLSGEVPRAPSPEPLLAGAPLLASLRPSKYPSKGPPRPGTPDTRPATPACEDPDIESFLASTLDALLVRPGTPGSAAGGRAAHESADSSESGAGSVRSVRSVLSNISRLSVTSTLTKTSAGTDGTATTVGGPRDVDSGLPVQTSPRYAEVLALLRRNSAAVKPAPTPTPEVLASGSGLFSNMSDSFAPPLPEAGGGGPLDTCDLTFPAPAGPMGLVIGKGVVGRSGYRRKGVFVFEVGAKSPLSGLVQPGDQLVGLNGVNVVGLGTTEITTILREVAGDGLERAIKVRRYQEGQSVRKCGVSGVVGVGSGVGSSGVGSTVASVKEDAAGEEESQREEEFQAGEAGEAPVMREVGVVPSFEATILAQLRRSYEVETMASM